ncbi:MAG: DUF1015 domain-containing protein [Actinomycetota bacterium]
MPDLFPFPGLRYQLGALDADLGALTAPPYDVIDEEGRARLEAAHPHNAVRLILPRDVEPGDRYRQARATFDAWQAEGVLAPDEPHLYVYRMTFTDEAGAPRRMTGVIGALELAPLDAEEVVPHEKTLPKAKSDRLELLRAVRANLDPVWALSPAEGLSALFEPVIAAGGAAASCVDEDGVEHCLFPIAGDVVDEIRRMIGEAPLLIADGHHRYETALAYQEEQRAAGVEDPGADRIMALIVEMTDDQLMIRPIHRLLRGASAHFKGKFNFVGDVAPMGANNPDNVKNLLAEMERTQSMGLIDGPGIALLTPKPAVLRPLLESLPKPLHDVDAVLFNVMVNRMAASVEIPEVDYRNDAFAVSALVAKGGADAAVLLRAPTVDQIAAVADAGARMPPKTTFFQPKPLTGLVFRSLDLG